ncbi:50S ribosomal protein L19-1, chloroplastic-like [Olea europaea var. sylvestris]|uniref:50S ribosomal protein L19-1, chloroplastic-like n=1 Tax=Olea europaea var. sylvestris TaxID=158386 RepID=UPI000C1CF1B5|nr:50S ribosomal protein L19-1, chloroplastic-like [Olea europaea var. sylvestris]
MQSLFGKVRFATRQTVSNLKNVEFKSICSLELNVQGHSFANSSQFNPCFGSSRTSFPNKCSVTKFESDEIAFKAPSYRSLSLGLTLSAAKVLTLPTRCMTTMAPAPQDASTSDDVPQCIKFKRLDKTARHIMQILDKEAVEEVKEKREIPDIRPGYIVQLKLEVPENKRRVQVIKGIVIAKRNAGLNTTFRIRRLVAGVGVESLFPLYSPNIKEIKVLDKKKVRRAKLYYLRDKMNALKRQ